MQSDGFQEETAVAGVLGHAVSRHCRPRWNHLQRRGRPETGHAGHTGATALFYFQPVTMGMSQRLNFH